MRFSASYFQSSSDSSSSSSSSRNTSSSSSSTSSADSSSKGSGEITFRSAPHSSQLMESPWSTSSSSTSIAPLHTGHVTINGNPPEYLHLTKVGRGCNCILQPSYNLVDVLPDGRPGIQQRFETEHPFHCPRQWFM